MFRFRPLAALTLCALLGLGACGPTATSDTQAVTARGSAPAFEIGDLPDPARWDRDDLWLYFFNPRGRNYTDMRNPPAHYKDHTIIARVAEVCGRPVPIAEARWGHSRTIRFYEDAIETTPRRLACWAETGPKVAAARGAEIEYLQTLLPAVARQPVPRGFERVNVDYQTRFVAGMLDYDTELSLFESQVKQFATAIPSLQRRVGMTRGWQREERASWNRAAAMAVRDFAQDNPMNQPLPGQGGSRTVFSDMFRNMPNADPRLGAALAELDRTMMGDDAFFRVQHQRAVAAARAAERANAGGGSSGGSSITLTRCVREEFSHTTASLCEEGDRAEAIAENDRARREQESRQASIDARRARERAARDANFARLRAAKEAAEAAMAECRARSRVVNACL